mmetsp:Transcript_22014/g.70904  ORF Transcript_22014/g.70904 Transcript_22014/m.70904 type:complete len:782 (-) Transcript_22014:454-2799(-)
MAPSATAIEREHKLFEYATEKSVDTAEIPLEEGWEKLREQGIEVIVDVLRRCATTCQPFGNKGYVSLYTISYRMCSSVGNRDHSKALYDRSQQELISISQSVLGELKQIHDTSTHCAETFLRHFAHHWANHKILVKWIQQLFRHLDNGYVANTSRATLTSVGLRAFYDHVFIPLKFELSEAIFFAIDCHRDGKDVDLGLIRSCVDVFPIMVLASRVSNLASIQAATNTQMEVSLYLHEFESKFLRRASDYYAQNSKQWLELASASNYLYKVETIIRQEAELSHQILHASTRDKLLKVCQRELLERHADAIVNQGTGMHFLLEHDHPEDLQRMYLLLHSSPNGAAAMTCNFHHFALGRAKAILKERAERVLRLKAEGKVASADDPVMVEQLLALRTRLTSMIATFFAGDSQFERALDSALQDVANNDISKETTNIEIFVMYTDRILSGKIKLPDESMEHTLNELLHLFLLIADKDLYAERYREQLAKRLLAKRYVSLHTERAMIVKLKTQQGAPFTTKLEGMINDFTIGEDLGRSWSSLRETSCRSGIKFEFSVQVLTQGFWPAQKQRELHLTSELQEAKTQFNAWYKERHSHRLLAWIHALDNVVVRAMLRTRSYDLLVSTFQAIALLLFHNSHVSLAFRDVCERMRIDSATGRRVLHSLACGKHRVLLKTGHRKVIDPALDQFKPNKLFTSKLKRFSITMPVLDAERRRDLESDVQHQRNFSIDATLVRIMKARKRLVIIWCRVADVGTDSRIKSWWEKLYIKYNTSPQIANSFANGLRA